MSSHSPSKNIINSGMDFYPFWGANGIEIQSRKGFALNRSNYLNFDTPLENITNFELDLYPFWDLYGFEIQCVKDSNSQGQASYILIPHSRIIPISDWTSIPSGLHLGLKFKAVKGSNC